MVAVRAFVVGGSMGGLAAALELRDSGWDVCVLEQRTQPLDGRGAGIILQPETAQAVTKRDPDALRGITTGCRWLRQLERTDGDRSPDSDSRPESESDSRPRAGVHFEAVEPWTAVSWTGLYHRLRDQWADGEYLLGWPVEEIDESGESVRVSGPSGTLHADVVVLADGVSSRLHRWMGAELSVESSGYVGWRGTALLAEMSAEAGAILDDAITYAGTGEGHIVMYPIDVPGEGRRLNYVWYRPLPVDSTSLLTDVDGVLQERSIAPGKVAPEHVAELLEAADRQLPRALAEVIRRTREPFLQVIVDQRIDRMISPGGRILALGDSAFAARPHAAAGTAKALEDAMELGAAMTRAGLRDQGSVSQESVSQGSVSQGSVSQGSVSRELTRWARERMAVGAELVDRAAAMGHAANAPGFSLSDPAFRFGLHSPTRS